MKAKVCLTLASASAEETQRLLKTLCEGLVLSGSATEYTFEIETDKGVVTEKCILSEGNVVA
jgi:hypothetical protein